MAKKEVLWHELTRIELEHRRQHVKVIIIPVGSIEQHGPHLTIINDTATITSICNEIALQLHPQGLVLPPIATGFSPHHLCKRFPGAITLRAETLINLLLDTCESIQQWGFKNIVIMNGHGGNRQVAWLAARTARERFGLNVAAICYWDIIPQEKRIEIMGLHHHAGAGHAGEFETSLSLHLFPERVRLGWLKGLDTDGSKPEIPYFPHYMDEITQYGFTDDPNLGSKEKGEQLFNVIIDGLTTWFQNFLTMTSQLDHESP